MNTIDVTIACRSGSNDAMAGNHDTDEPKPLIPDDSSDRSELSHVETNACPECGKRVGPTDRYCHNCGALQESNGGQEPLLEPLRAPSPDDRNKDDPSESFGVDDYALRQRGKKLCRRCKQEMERYDSTCPHCHERQSFLWSPRPYWQGTVAALLVVGVFLLWSTGALDGLIGAATSQRIDKADLEQQLVESDLGGRTFVTGVGLVGPGEPTEADCIKKASDGSDWKCYVEFQRGESHTYSVAVDEDGSWIAN